MKTKKKTTKIVLSRSITLMWPQSVIPAGTELIFDEEGVSTYQGEPVYMNRIHIECVENPSHEFLDNYFPDYRVNENDEILACDEVLTDRLLTSNFGEVPIRRYALGIEDSVSLALEFDNTKNWHEIINDNNLGIKDTDIFSAVIEYTDYAHYEELFNKGVLDENSSVNTISFIIANKNELVFRLLSYDLALHPYEICEGDLGLFRYKNQEDVLPIRCGRGKEWFERQLKLLPEAGRNGLPPKVIFPVDDTTLCIYGEIGRGQLILSPIEKEYGLEVFTSNIFKDTDVFYRRSTANIPFREDMKSTPLRYIHRLGYVEDGKVFVPNP